ncbi:Ribosomal protein S18 acetylase RimI [Nocardioides sp. YR527]|uniref:GNAT family N-acetyltransferase n=1 Tax=Nocardioides sp. YR527 TaxID=1881028 RepID=UPI000880A4A6|nr:GNAT family N-acetyltransferase [Nocardioides sp. YR527]SDJ83582.1 Ribosomal protein S18 acetylase RimI [Nocardioides sp. YR527]
MTMNTTRVAEPDDLPLLSRIEAAGDAMFVDHFGHDPGWPPPTEGAVRAIEPGFLLVAVHGADVVGFAHVLELDGHMHLEQLAVDPVFQGCGHGRALVEAAMGRAAATGARRMTLMTYADVPWNAPLYRHLGFVETEPTEPYEHRLVETERQLGLDQEGRRVLMEIELSGVPSEV